MNDIVVDTNVFMHSSDPTQVAFHESSVNFLIWLTGAACKTLLMVDSKGRMDPEAADPNSLILEEYRAKLRGSTLGYQALMKLLATRRIRYQSRSDCSANDKKFVQQLIRKPRDRTFLLVALQTSEKIFISHDFEDFAVQKRNMIKRERGLSVETASDALMRTGIAQEEGVR